MTSKHNASSGHSRSTHMRTRTHAHARTHTHTHKHTLFKTILGTGLVVSNTI